MLEPVVERLGLRRRSGALRLSAAGPLVPGTRADAPASCAGWWSHIDERRNALAYGVPDKATAAAVRVQAEALGIPSQAVLVEVTGQACRLLGP